MAWRVLREPAGLVRHGALGLRDACRDRATLEGKLSRAQHCRVGRLLGALDGGGLGVLSGTEFVDQEEVGALELVDPASVGMCGLRLECVFCVCCVFYGRGVPRRRAGFVGR